jgi:MFS family permease
MILLPFYNYLFFAMFRNSVSVIFPELKIELIISEPELGALITVELSTSLLTNFAAIPLERRFGRRGTCILGLFLCFLGVLSFSFSGTYPLALLSFAIVGAGQGIFVPAFYSTLGDALPKRRGIILGVANSVFTLGGFVGPIMVAGISALYGWRGPFLLLAVGGLSGVTIDYLLSKPLSREASQRVPSANPMLDLVRLRNIRILLITSFISAFGMGTFLAWTPTFLRVTRSMEIGAAGLVFGLASAAGVIGCITAGGLSDSFDRRFVVFSFGIAAGLISFLFYSLAQGAFQLAFLSMLFGFFSYPYWNLHMTLAQVTVAKEEVTAATAFVRAAAVSGSAIAPLLTGVLIPLLGLSVTLTYFVPLSFFLYGLLALTLTHLKTD